MTARPSAPLFLDRRFPDRLAIHRTCGPGRAALLSLSLFLLAACGENGTGPPDPGDGPILRGTVHAVGDESPDGLWAVWRTEDGEAADSARVQSDGGFEIQASRMDSEGELLVDRSEPRTFHPFLFPFQADALDGLDILVIPRSWTIRTGVYADERVPTPLDPAVEDDADQLLYSYYFAQPHPRDAPVRYLLDLMTWPAENLPVKVAIDHAGSSTELLRETLRLARELEIPEALMPSVIGEQRILLGRPALPDLRSRSGTADLSGRWNHRSSRSPGGES